MALTIPPCRTLARSGDAQLRVHTSILKVFTQRGTGPTLTVEGALGLHFFLSYAHGEQADNDRVGRFFSDLSTEIRILTGDDRHEVVGFHDSRNLRAGDPWPRELVEALATASTFVALCSPRYIRSPQCGKEWAVFAERVDAYETATGKHAPSIIPVFWVWTEDVPAVVADIQHRDQSFGERYEAEGLRELMRMDQDRDYHRLVRGLAIRIRDVARTFELPRLDRRPDFHQVASAFEPQPAEDPGPLGGNRWEIPTPRPELRPADGKAVEPGEPPPRRPILELDPDPADQ